MELVPLARSSCCDKAPMDSFFHAVKTTSVDFAQCQSRAEAQQHLFDYIRLFYGQKHLHSPLGYYPQVEKFQTTNKTASV
jgi:putative transposase